MKKLFTVLFVLSSCTFCFIKSMEHKLSAIQTEDKRQANEMLLDAMLLEDSKMVKKALSLGADVNYTFADRTPLHIAANTGNVYIAELLVKHGANINAHDTSGWTPLHQAADAGELYMVQWLIEHGANINVQDIDGKTPLTLAAKKNHLKLVIWLITHGAHVSRKDRDALHLQSKNSLIQSILANNAEKAKDILNRVKDYQAVYHLTYQEKVELGRQALPLALALDQSEIVNDILDISHDIIPAMQEDTLVAAATTSPLYIFSHFYDLARGTLSGQQAHFASILEEALVWAALNRREDIVDFILQHAFVQGEANNLGLKRVGHLITKILKICTGLSEQDREAFTRIQESILAIPRIRLAGRQRNIFDALAEIVPQLPPELLALILGFTL